MGLRIFLPEALAADTTVVLPKAQSRHVQVLRLQPGDGIALFNGLDGLEWPAEILRIDRQSVELRIGAAISVERELALHVTLAFGIPANERMDALVEKATELGVAAIQPLICERSVVRLAGDRAEARQAHWSAVAASASEQSGRVRVPQVGVPMKLDAWLRALAGDAQAASAGCHVLSFDSSAVPVARLADPDGLVRRIVLSGPEGGLSPDEEAGAAAAGFSRVSLGPRVLRADTAPIALLAWLGLTRS